MTFFRQFLHAKANFSDRHYASMSSKNSNLHAKKMLIIGRLLFLNLYDCSNFCNSVQFAKIWNRQKWFKRATCQFWATFAFKFEFLSDIEPCFLFEKLVFMQRFSEIGPHLLFLINSVCPNFWELSILTCADCDFWNFWRHAFLPISVGFECVLCLRFQSQISHVVPFGPVERLVVCSVQVALVVVVYTNVDAFEKVAGVQFVLQEDTCAVNCSCTQNWRKRSWKKFNRKNLANRQTVGKESWTPGNRKKIKLNSHKNNFRVSKLKIYGSKLLWISRIICDWKFFW